MKWAKKYISWYVIFTFISLPLFVFTILKICHKFILLLPIQILYFRVFAYPLLSYICIFFLPCQESQVSTIPTIIRIRILYNFSLVLSHSSFKITVQHNTNTMITEEYLISFFLFSLKFFSSLRYIPPERYRHITML